MSKKLVTVFGATGAQGGSVARALLAKLESYVVRAVTRNPKSAKAQELKELGAEVVKADLDDTASVGKAMKGAYGVFAVTNFWELFSVEKEVQQGKTLVDKAIENGVSHFIYSGLENVEKLIGTPCPHFDAKGLVEEYLKQNKDKLTFTSVRCSFYMENLLSDLKPYKIGDNQFALNIPMEGSAMSMVPVAEIGPCVVNILENKDRYAGQFIGLGSDMLTIEQYAAILSKHLAPAQFVASQMTTDAFAQLGFPGASDLAVMFKFYITGNPDRSITTTKALNPNISTFEQWVIANKEALQKITQA